LSVAARDSLPHGLISLVTHFEAVLKRATAIALRWRTIHTTSHPANADTSICRLNILVDVENISGVPFGLDLRQPGVVCAVGAGQVGTIVLIKIVHVAGCCAERFQLGKYLTCPSYIRFILSRILPLRN